MTDTGGLADLAAAPHLMWFEPQYYDPAGPGSSAEPGTCFGGDQPPADFEFQDDNRWTRTATNGGNLQQGDATTLTWSLIPDGTVLNGFSGEPTAPSELLARLDTIYGVPAGTPIIERAWFDLLVQMFASWSDETGLRFVYEANDDGVGISSSNRGELGTRGDIRLGGHPIDGNNGVLGYNFYPDMGDMVLDTNDSFFANTGTNSIRLRNVMAHETGHGLGLSHVCPINQTKLLEPYYTGAFDGPQHDDILAVNRGYADTYEWPHGNDSFGEATVVGSWDVGDHTIDGGSIDNAGDIDHYRFALDGPQQLDLTLAPVGSIYKSGPQNANGSCSPGTDFNSQAQNDLAVEVWTRDGRFQLAAADLTGLGESEVLSGLRLPSAGEYVIRVTGADANAQLYQITASVSALTGSVDGLVEFEQRVVAIGQPVTIAVRDADLIGNGSVAVTVTSQAGDSEVLSLTEVGRGVFRSTVNLADTSGLQTGNGVLEASAGSTLTVQYVDAADRSGGSATAQDTTAVFQQVCTTQDGFEYVACTIMPQFEDIRATGTALPTNTDNTTTTLTDTDLGSFQFTFYGTTYTSLSVNTNGLLTFGGAASNANTNTNLTTAPSQATIAVFWDDLRTDGEADEIYWEVRGSGASQRLIIQWNEVGWTDLDADTVDDRGDGLTFQVVLGAGSESIELNFLDLDGGQNVDGNEGSSATVGIKDSGTQGDRRLLLAYNDSSSDFVGTGRSVRIARQPALTLTITPPAFAEHAGAAAATATVTRTNADLSVAQVVQLSSDDTTEATVPATVTIPANQSSASFPVNAVDDQLLDGTVTVTIEAAVAGFISGSDTVDVTDHETVTITIVADSIVESDGAGATLATVTRSNTDTGQPLVVTLTSNDTTEAAVAATVTIPASAAAANVAIDAIDDLLLDGTQTVTISATATGYVGTADTLDVLDYETVSVTVSGGQIAENAGAAATTATVTRSNTDTGSPLTVQLSSADTTEATVPANVTIPAGQASVAFQIDAIDDDLLDGTQAVTITPTATGYASLGGTVDVTDQETLTVAITAAAISEAAGPAATTATVTRSNTDNGQALVVTLASDDTSEATTPATVTIPANEPSVAFAINAIDDDLLDGTQTATITGSATGYVPIPDTVDVTDLETLTLVIAADTIAEDAGPAATTATLTRHNTNLAAPLIVALVSNDTSEATVPANVTIPANEPSVVFAINAMDDALLDGTQTVTITASATDYVVATDSVDVLDSESLSVVISVVSVPENAGPAAVAARVVRPTTTTDQSLVVTLTSSDPSEVTVPASVTIPANENHVDFSLDIVDDTLLDGTQTVTITAAGAGFEDGSDTLDVTDHETLTVVVDRAAIAENAGPAAASATVTRSNTDIDQAVVVTLTSDDISEATVPASIMIPAGLATAVWDIDAVDDLLLDGTQTVTITATATGYVEIADTLDVTDYELLTITITPGSVLENAGTAAATATIARSNTDTDAPLSVALSSSDTSEATIPASVTIPANQASTTVAIDAMDDDLLDGTQTVTITVSASDYAGSSDTLAVEDYETLTVVLDTDVVSERAGVGATTATITRSNTDNQLALDITLQSSDTTEATVPATVTIPAGQDSVTFAIAAIDDDLLDGPQTLVIHGVAAGYVAVGDHLTVEDYETLTVVVAADSVRESDGAAATTATVTRSNMDNGQALIVSLTSSDTSEAQVSASVTIPAGEASATFAIDAIDDDLLDGTQTVLLEATATGYVSQTDTLDVLDSERLTLSLAVSQIAENDGVAATMATVTRGNTDQGSALLIALSSSDTSEAQVPASVIIPAGAASVTFAVDAVDDTLLDGTQTVTIVAMAAGYPISEQALQVTDHETLLVTLAQPSVRENAGAAATTAIIIRSNTDNTAALPILLTSSDTTEATIQTTVTIPANQAAVTVPINAVDDDLLDGTQTVLLAAWGEGYVAMPALLDVTDYELLTLSIEPDWILENAGAAAATGTVTRNNTDTAEPLVVALTSLDLTEARVEASVTIPSGATSVSFAIDAVDDQLFDGTQVVVIRAAATGYVEATDTLQVRDHETLALELAAGVVAENNGAGATTATITRGNTDIGTALTLLLSSSDTSEAAVPTQVTIPANASTIVVPIDAVDDHTLDGTRTVTISVAAEGYVAASDTLEVTDHETLTLVLNPETIAENGGPGAAVATVTRSNTEDAAALAVSLTSSDTSEATVPATVLIPADAFSASFAIDAVDDQLLDGPQTVTITVAATGLFGEARSLQVLDHETLTLTVEPEWVVENDGAAAAAGTVTRNNTDLADPLVVVLTSLDPTEARVEASVTIPAGAASASFAIDVVDDTLWDDTQTAVIRAAASGYVTATDTLQVRDYETLTLVLTDSVVAENDGAGATTATITRSNTDIGAALVLLLSSSDTSEATVAKQVTIPANATAIVVPVDAVDDHTLDGTRTVALWAGAEGYVSVTDTLAVTDHETLTLVLSPETIAENGGPGAAVATVTRSNTEDANPLTVNLASNDTSEAAVPATVTIPADAFSAVFAIDAVDDQLLDGSQTVTVTVTAAGLFGDARSVQVLDHETLTLTLADLAIREDAGLSASTATVTRSNTDTLEPLVVRIANSDASEVTGPAEITIPAGQSAFTFPLDAVDDTLLDGTQRVTFTVTADDYMAHAAEIDVLDVETLSLTVAAEQIREDQGAAVVLATLARSNTDVDDALLVTLDNSDPTELGVPLQVLIETGQATVQFPLDAVDDTLLDGTQVVTLTAAAAGYEPGSDTLEVLDHETLTIAIQSGSIGENAGLSATTLTVTRSNTDTAIPLDVAVLNGDSSELAIPAVITIAAGQQTALAAIDAVDDTLLDGVQTVMITVQAAGYLEGAATLDVTDHEWLTLTLDLAAVAEDAGPAAATGTVIRSNTDTAEPLIVWLVSSDLSEITVPASVTIPAGESSLTFPVDAIDDDLLDSSQTIVITATEVRYVGDQTSVEVTDHETLTLTLDTGAIGEQAGPGAATATVRRNNVDIALPLTVLITNGDASELHIPASVVIPAGAAEVSFALDAVDDQLLDGSQIVPITTTAAGYFGAGASIEVRDYETLTLELASGVIREDGGPAATLGTVTRSNLDTDVPLIVQLSSLDPTEAAVPVQVLIPAGAAEVTFAIDAIDDTLLDGTRTVVLEAIADTYVTGQITLDVTDHETLSIALDRSSVREDSGTGAVSAVVSRSNTDQGTDLSVVLTNSDGTEIQTPQQVTIPAGSGSVEVALDVLDDTLLDGTIHVTLTVAADGYYGDAAELDVEDHEWLTVTLDRSTIRENAGANAATLTVARSNSDLGQPLQVHLLNSDLTEVAVATLLEIPAGEAQVDVPLDAVDDTLLDGAQTAILAVTATGYYGDQATLDITDHEQLTLVLDGTTVAENAGPQSVTAVLMRSNTDTDAALQVALAVDDPTEAAVPALVTIPTGSQTVSFALDAVDDTLLDGAQTVLVTAVAAPYVPAEQELVVEDHETLQLELLQASLRENAGSDVLAARVTRSNTDRESPLTVTVSSSDTTELTAPTTVTIAAGQASALIPLDAVDDTLLDGTQPVLLDVQAGGYLGDSGTLEVTDYELLTLELDATFIREDAGPAGVTATVTRSNTDIDEPLVVQLASDDDSEARVPLEVIIPGGAASASFAIDVIDDALLDGTQAVTISAAADGYEPGHSPLDVQDHETLSVTVSASVVSEQAGPAAVELTVTRNNVDHELPLAVTLTSGDDTELALPATATIPAGSAAVTIFVDAVDDTRLDGAQIVSLSGGADGYESAVKDVTVSDYETVSLMFQEDAVQEFAGSNTTLATVTRSNTDIDTALMIDLTGGDPTELVFPATVTIPAGAQSIEFAVDVLEDYIADGDQAVTVTASATGYESTADALVVVDNPTPWHNWRNGLDVNNDGKVKPQDALLIINYLSRTNGNSQLPALPATPPPFYDVRPDNRVTPIDALLIINYLSAHPLGEGEAADMPAVAPTPTDGPLGDPTGPSTSGHSSPAPVPPAELPRLEPSVASAPVTYGPATNGDQARTLLDHYWAQRERAARRELERVLDLLADDLVTNRKSDDISADG